MKPNRNPFTVAFARPFLVIGSIAVTFGLPAASAAAFTYTNATTGTTQWSAGTNWDATPVSATSTTLTFGNATVLSASSAIVSNNDIGGDFKLNILNMTYAGPASGTAPTTTISGNRLEFISNAAVTPTLVLNTTGTVKPTVTIANNLLLTNDLSIAATTNATFSGVISGAGNLTKSGAGVVTLTAPANSYTGTTTLALGVMDVGTISNGSLGGGGLIFTGGVLQGNGTFTRNFNTTNLLTAADGEIAGATGGFSARGGPLTVNFGGASAQVTLSGPSFRLGTGFTLNASTANNKVTVVNPIALNGSARVFTVNTGTGGDSAELSGELSGTSTAGMNKQGSGQLKLSAANTYAGPTTVSAGSLVISNATALGAAALGGSNTTSVSDGANLQLTGGIVTDPNESLTISGTGGAINAGSLHAGTGGGTWSGPITLGAVSSRIGATPGNTLTVTGTISNGTTTSLAISGQSGTGTVILDPVSPNTYTGQTTLVRGTLRLGKTNALPVTTVLDGKDAANSTDATGLDLAGFDQTLAGLFDTGSNANDLITNSVAATTSNLTVNNTASYTFDGTIQDSAGIVAFTKNGTGTLSLTGANSYSGDTVINLGVLAIKNDSGLGDVSGITTVVATGTISTGGRLTVSNNITTSENIILSGNTEQAGGFNASLESASGTNSLDGNITLAGTGGQRINSTGSGSLIVNGPIAREGTDSGILVLRTGDSSATLTVNNTIDLNGGGLNVQGAGTVTLNAASTDFSSTTIAFGGPDLTLVLGVSDALPAAGDLTIGTSNTTAGTDQGVFDLAGFSQTVRSLNGIRSSGASPSDASFRRITNSSGTPAVLTAGNEDANGVFDGVIEGGNDTVALTKVGSGALTLLGNNTYTGPTTVSNGTLGFIGGSQSSPITVASGAFLRFTLDSPTTSTAAVNLGTGKVKIIGTPAPATSYTLMTASSISGTPVLENPIAGHALVVEGGNVLKLNAVGGGNTYSDWLAANSPATGFVTDSDNDGVPNGVENVLGTNPNSPTAGLTQVSATAGSATFSHTLNPSIASDVSYGYQWSTNLVEWKASAETNGGGTTATIVPSAPVAGVVTVTTTINSGPAGKLFLRLDASQP